MERGVAPKTANTRNCRDIRRRLAGKLWATPRKQQEEGFAGGLPARNARMFRWLWITLWIIMGFIHMPRIRV